MHKYILGLLLLGGLVTVQGASADTLQNCGSCGGVTYMLNVTPDSPGPTLGTEWFDFTLTVNTTGINVPTAQVLNAVALKDPGALGAKLISVSAGTWSMVPGGTNNGGTSGTGCVMNTKNGFDCAQATIVTSGTGTANGVPTGAGDTYTFVFGFLLPSNSSGDLASGVGLKAYYDTTSGGFGGLQTSETFSASPVPEPNSLVLLGSGLLGLAFLLRRR